MQRAAAGRCNADNCHVNTDGDGHKHAYAVYFALSDDCTANGYGNA